MSPAHVDEIVFQAGLTRESHYRTRPGEVQESQSQNKRTRTTTRVTNGVVPSSARGALQAEVADAESMVTPARRTVEAYVCMHAARQPPTVARNITASHPQETGTPSSRPRARHYVRILCA